MACIYKITNQVNGKAYIGITVNSLEFRISQHRRDVRCIMHKAFKKYGIENFDIEVLMDSEEYPLLNTLEYLNKSERNFIKVFNTLAPNGYNFRTGGGAGGKCSEETKRKISESLKGEKHQYYRKSLTPEHREKIGDAQRGEKNHAYGKSPSAETRRKRSIALKGRVFTDEHKRKIGLANKGKKHTEETRRKMAESKKGKVYPHHGKPHTEETKRKISLAKKGFRHTEETKRHLAIACRGWKQTEDTKRRISESKYTPERKKTREYYLTLPPDMSLTDKRIKVRAFSGKGASTVHRWVKAWENGSKF